MEYETLSGTTTIFKYNNYLTEIMIYISIGMTPFLKLLIKE